MTSDAHLDGNVMGGLLMEIFGQEMTDALGCCAHCGDKNLVGALSSTGAVPVTSCVVPAVRRS